jgi:hypothetical protein
MYKSPKQKGCGTQKMATGRQDIYLEIIFVLFSQQKQAELLLWENQL